MKPIYLLCLTSFLAVCQAYAGDESIYDHAFPNQSHADRGDKQMIVLGGGMEAVFSAGAGTVLLSGDQIGEDELRGRLKSVQGRIGKGAGNWFDLEVERSRVERQWRENQMIQGKIAPVSADDHLMVFKNKMGKRIAGGAVVYFMIDGGLRVVNALNGRESGLLPAGALVTSTAESIVKRKPTPELSPAAPDAEAAELAAKSAE